METEVVGDIAMMGEEEGGGGGGDVPEEALAGTYGTQATQPVNASQEEDDGEMLDASEWGQLVHTERSSLAGDAPVLLAEDSYSVGRSDEREVTLRDASVSSTHCVFLREGRIAYVKHVGSSNGTYLNGDRKRLAKDRPYPLRHGDVISLVRPHPPDPQQMIASNIQNWFEVRFEVPAHLRQREQTSQASQPHNMAPFPVPEAPLGREAAKTNPLCDELVARFRVVAQLGRGAYATVYKVEERDTGKEFAIKVVEKHQFRLAPPQKWVDQRNEAAMMRRMNHRGVVQIFDCLEDSRAIYFVMELLRGGELFDRIINKGAYPEATAQRLVRNILEAVAYLHDNDVVHRDLKPENIMLVSHDSDVDIKLVDFGVAKEERGGRATVCGTLDYIAPEVLQRKVTLEGLGRYGKSADMWSLGVVVYVVLTRTPLFPNQANPHDDKGYWSQRVQEAFASNEWLECRLSVFARDFVAQLLEVDESRRLTARKALQHPWMTRIGSLEPPANSLSTSQQQVGEAAPPRPVDVDSRMHSEESVGLSSAFAACAASGSLGADDSTGFSPASEGDARKRPLPEAARPTKRVATAPPPHVI